LAETNRTSFDFVEGESEFVAGCTVVYVDGEFALIFSAEFASICFRDHFFLFGGGVAMFIPLFFILRLFLSIFLFVWVRGNIPRFRYDKLIYLAWKRFLPLSLTYF